MKQYKLTVSENQLRVLMIALESYFRTRMGQFIDLADDLAFCGYEYGQPHNGKQEDDFTRRIHRRDSCKDLMDHAFSIAQPRITANGYYPKTPHMISAIDAWRVIRHQFWKEKPNKSKWTTDADEPYQQSGEPLIKIEVCND